MSNLDAARRRLLEMAGLEQGWRAHLAELLAWPVAVIAMVLSYRAEVDLGNSLATFRGWPAFVWPIGADIADVMLLILAIEYRRLGLRTWKVDVGLIACTAVMVAANIRSAWGDPTAVLMQAWSPGIALWIFHTLAGGRKPRGAPVDLGAVWRSVRRSGAVRAPKIAPQERSPNALENAPGGAREGASKNALKSGNRSASRSGSGKRSKSASDTLLERARKFVVEYQAERGRMPTGAELAAELDCVDSYARKLLVQIREAPQLELMDSNSEEVG